MNIFVHLLQANVRLTGFLVKYTSILPFTFLKIMTVQVTHVMS